MEIQFKDWLLTVKSILIYYKICNTKTTLHTDSWMTLYDMDLSPNKAVVTDMGDYILPYGSWEDINNIYKQLKNNQL